MSERIGPLEEQAQVELVLGQRFEVQRPIGIVVPFIVPPLVKTS